MSDPFETLFGEDPPATPRPDFAEQLRAQVIGELGELLTSDGDSSGPSGVAGRSNHGSLFYFTLPAADVDLAGEFYRQVFDWELHQGDAGYHVANVYPPMGLASNDSTNPRVWIEVDDIEAAVVKVRELGGTATEPVHYDSGWSSDCVDPQGVAFSVQVPTAAYRQAARRSTESGELFYWSLPAPQAAQSKAFYQELFGWEFGNPGNQGGMHVENRLPDGGIGGGREGSHPELFFRVTDLDRAITTIRRLGGTAEPAGEGPEGRHAMCVDNQGVVFGLSEPSEEY
jgi:predicted enzyme related to lactoylglutathione lyase